MSNSQFSFSKLISCVLCIFISGNCIAQSKKFLATDNLNKSYILNDATSVRLGKGVVAWIFKISDGFDYASQHYFSCDGRHISDSINFQSSAAPTASEREAELLRLVKQKQAPSTSWAEIREYETSEIELKNKIRSNLKEICANASRESKEYLFPFAQSSKDKDNVFTISNIVSGSFSRKGDTVEGWTRTYDVKSKEHRLPNGDIFYFKDGTPMMNSELKDKSYLMNRYSVNCKDEKTAEVAYAQYDNYGQLKPNSAINIAKPVYEFPIPQTIGSRMVSVFCTIY